MKRLHRRDLHAWSKFEERLDIDFNSFAWARGDGDGGGGDARGCVVIDPLPLSPHDAEHLRKLGGVEWVVLTNSDHVRAAREVVAAFGAKVAAPRAERETFPIACARWLGDGDELVPGLVALEMHGSKTPGELALILDDTTLFTGDLVRAHRANALMMLSPEQGLKDRVNAAASVARLAERTSIEAVLVGDGWCVFRDGAAMLRDLAATLGS